MNRFISSISSLFLCILLGCSPSSSLQLQPQAINGSAPNLMIHYGCPTCHVIPHVPGAVGKVGPSLGGNLEQRSYLAGTIPNNSSNLQQWIMHPQQLRPGTAMPEMGVTSNDAQQIARFLYSTR